MKRVMAVLLSSVVLLGWGCGYAHYEFRLNRTLEDLKYRQRLDDNLIPAPNDAKFKDFPMYIRPPKEMALSKEFMMGDLPAGQYDLATTFFSQGKGTLHVLGRRKTTAKRASAKNAAPTPEVQAQRGEFVQDVTNLLLSFYGAIDALQSPKFQADSTKKTAFQRLSFTAPNGDVVQAYVYKKDPYEVALIWNIPAGAHQDAKLGRARDLCLQSFGVGNKASRSFSGSLSETETGEAGAAAGAGGESATPF